MEEIKGIQWFISELAIVFDKHVASAPQPPVQSELSGFFVFPFWNQFQAININGLELHEFIKFPELFFIQIDWM